MVKFVNTNKPPKTIKLLIVSDIDTILKISDKYASMRYEEMQTKVIPNEKFKFLLGFNSCHINGIPNNKIGYAVRPSLLFTLVNK